MKSKEKDKKSDKDLSEFMQEADERTTRNLEEQGLIAVNPDNPDEARLTEKGADEVSRWKDKNPEMDFLLFLFRETGERLKKILKKEENKN